MYDGVTLDQTDVADTSLVFEFQNKPPKINVASFSAGPSNYGETSTYSLTLSPEVAISSTDTMELVFSPEAFSSTLSTLD